MGKLARNLDETQLRGITNSIPPGQSDEALAAARVWDDAAEAGFRKLARGGFKHDDLAVLLTRHADQPQVLDDLLGVVDDSAFAAWAPRHTDGLSRLLLRSGGLSADAIKHLPFNALDEAFYPGFGQFLESGSGYLSRHLEEINRAARAGDSSAVLGHLNNVLGEYREARFLRHAVDDLGHQRVFSHLDEFGSVNAPGYDAITLIESEGIYYLAEVKDRGRAFGTIIDGPKIGSRLAPSDLKNYIVRRPNNVFEFNEIYFQNQMEFLARNGGLTGLEREAIEAAYEEGRLVIQVFAGGNPSPFGPTIDTLDSLISPTSGRTIDFRAIADFP